MNMFWKEVCHVLSCICILILMVNRWHFNIKYITYVIVFRANGVLARKKIYNKHSTDSDLLCPVTVLFRMLSYPLAM
jgi:hypothetical protein